MSQYKPMRQPDMTATFVRILLQLMNEDERETFLYRLTVEFSPDVQLKLYEFIQALASSWAGQQDLERSTAFIIEDCRKICDVMGWPVAQ